MGGRQPRETDLSRRGFLKLGAAFGAGLAIGYTPAGSEAADDAEDREATGPGEALGADPRLWIRIGPDDSVTVVLPRCEMGQGITTTLPMLVAEELEAEWSTVRIEWAPLDPGYGRQLTAASESMRTLWMPLRTAGALCREMLITAATRAWGADRAQCRVERGRIVHAPSGRSTRYGALATAAAALPVPSRVSLKPRSEFRLIGGSVRRLDVPGKVAGTARYGLDVTLPDMLVATIAHSPVFLGRLRSFDAAPARAVPGVRDVVPIAASRTSGWTAIAVVADGFWAAHQGLRALALQWDDGPHGGASTASVSALLRDLVGGRARTVAREGNPRDALASVAHRVEAEYETPYLAHVPMEPMTCTARVGWRSCEVWVPTQNPNAARAAAARASRLPESAVTVHQTYLGGGFGRRQRVDYVAETVEIARVVGAPVKLVWSREEDVRHDYYRPATLHRLTAGLDARGLPLAWIHRIAGIGSWTLLTQGVDVVPYEIPHAWITLARRARGPVRTGPWRGLARSQNAFASEAFLDEVARAGGLDPVEIRLRLLSRAPRYRAVLELAAGKAAWDRPPPAGRHRGVALSENFGGICAQVAEVSASTEGGVRVHRVVCALDCGQVVHPGIVTAQMEGGIVFGLSAALGEAITLEAGRVRQGNFHDYPVLRMPAAPAIEVHLVDSDAPPAGVGETAVPAIAPAVANAVLAATGRAVRALPILRGIGLR